jgi:hypothetical protein
MSEPQMGLFGTKQSAKNGKGSYISDTHGDSWLSGIEKRLSARKFPCSKCGVVREAGACPEPCGYNSEFGGW